MRDRLLKNRSWTVAASISYVASMFAYTIALMFVNLTGPIERGELAFFWMFVTGMWVFALVAAYILDTLRGTVHRVEKGKEGGR